MFYGTFFTPVATLCIPFVIILTIVLLFGSSLGYKDFYYPSLLIWIVGIFIFWLPSLLFSVVFLKKTNKYNYPYQDKEFKSFDKFSYYFSYVLIIILFLGLSKSIQQADIGTDEFQNDFGSGLVAHISIISKFFFIYLIVYIKRKNIIPIILFLAIYFMYGAKSWILIPLLAAIIIRIILKKTYFGISLTIKALTIAILIFYLVYYVSIGPDMPLDFIVTHFFSYLFSGILGLSEYIKADGIVGIDPNMLINPIVNLYNKINGTEIMNTFSNVDTAIGNGAEVNVKTLFGTFYLYGGLFWGILFTFVLGSIYYLLLILTITIKSNIILITYFTLLTLLFFGWFDTYTSNLFIYEFLLFGILVYLFIELLKIKKNSKYIS
uniref:DUF6337 family protein n=1 Tax=Flavobacterium sp. TaxID=239 RepID=UPI00404A7634